MANSLLPSGLPGPSRPQQRRHPLGGPADRDLHQAAGRHLREAPRAGAQRRFPAGPHGRRALPNGLFHRHGSAGWPQRPLLSRHAALPTPLFPGLRRPPPGAAVTWDYYGDPRPDVQAVVSVAGRRVLDVGCEGGTLAAALKASGAAFVAGVERHPEAAAHARPLLDALVEGDLLT